MTMLPRLLLISTSTVFGTGYLDHAEPEIRSALGDASRVVFVPYALADRAAYAAKAIARFQSMGFQCASIEDAHTPQRALDNADAIFVGGGNTFRLLKALHELGLIQAIRDRVSHGMVYMSASAGSNVACPTIRTTNDMPIVEPPTLNALNLFPFQINPHYQDPDPDSKHMGETREERLLQYLEENETPVIGLREGAILSVSNGRIQLRGVNGARIFQRKHPPQELAPPADLLL
jgi:dipeptidase E